MKKQLTGLMERMLFGTLFPSRTSTLANLVLPYIKDKDKVLDLGPRTGKVAEYIVNHRDIKITLLIAYWQSLRFTIATTRIR